MNIYNPYNILAEEDSLLHLKLSFKDRLISIISSRVLPLLIVIILFATLDSIQKSISIFVTAGLVFLALTSIILLNARTGLEVVFKASVIEIYSLRLLGKRKLSIALEDADYIELEIFNDPRVSGAFYRIVLKNKKRILLLKFPAPESPDEERFINLNLKLEALTHLKIKTENTGKYFNKA
ncbi:MAG: hypothetical protein NTW54_02680 [Bacteroidetes bacterium]|nr:hypothetical protein [Bacteroidota bacterium]